MLRGARVRRVERRRYLAIGAVQLIPRRRCLSERLPYAPSVRLAVLPFFMLTLGCGVIVAADAPSPDAAVAPSNDAAEVVDGSFWGSCIATNVSSAGRGKLTLEVTAPANETWAVTSVSMLISGKADWAKTGTYDASLGVGSFDVRAGVSRMDFELGTPDHQANNLCFDCGDLSSTFTVTLDFMTPHGPLHVVAPPKSYACVV